MSKKEFPEWMCKSAQETFREQCESKGITPSQAVADRVNKVFKNEDKGIWIEPEVKSYECKFIFDIEPVKDLTEKE